MRLRDNPCRGVVAEERLLADALVRFWAIDRESDASILSSGVFPRACYANVVSGSGDIREVRVKDWWSWPGERDALGELLAKHPEAAARTERLAAGLTVMKLIRIANSEYNYCRLGRDIPADLEILARSEMAWGILDLKTGTITMRPRTAWIREAGFPAATPWATKGWCGAAGTVNARRLRGQG